MQLFSSYSWCEKLIIASISVIFSILLIDYRYAILPFHGIYVVSYVFCVTLCVMWITFYYLRSVLRHNKPYELDLERLLGVVAINKPVVPRGNIDERIEVFVKDIQVRFILKWYLHISTDPCFLSESKFLLDEVVRRFLQVVVDVNARKLAYGCSVVLLRHLKEFRRTTKRVQKNGGSMEELYRYAHFASKSPKAAQHFSQQLTASVLRQFINWELWNSLPCQSLVSILSRKFTTYLLTFVSTPGYLTYKILEACASEDDKVRLDLPRYYYISVSDVDHQGDSETSLGDNDVVDEVEVKESVPDCQVPEYLPSEPVKIYESRSTSNKTWRNSSDLECISLGQDLLTFQEVNDPETQIQQLIEKRLWKDNTEEDAPEPWNGDEPGLQHYLKPIGEVTSTTLHNMKELQHQATSSAMHKIGDLQDEAAGVVEGILDFGMAGLRKGLRLTGLQENFSELTQKAKNEFHDLHITTGKITEAIKIIDHDLHKHKLVKTPRVVTDCESDVWMNPIEVKESPCFDGDILLERTPDADMEIPRITEEVVVESPEPEYEDTQDFASTIAKLRSLLQQKSESGLTTPSLSPMPQEEADVKANGAMPSLYKFCTRTATGVFQNTLNSIKTALPGNTNDMPQAPCDWTFVEADSDNDNFNLRLKKLLSERQAYCTVDTAYEAIHSLEIADQVDVPAAGTQFEDELDEFDVHVPISRVLLDVVCELVADTNVNLLQETVVKALLLFIGHYTEEYVTKRADGLVHNVSKLVGKLPESIHQEVLPMKLEEIVAICVARCPVVVKTALGVDTIESGIEMFVSSLQSPKINRDIFMQVFELFASQLIDACSQSSPTYSA